VSIAVRGAFAEAFLEQGDGEGVEAHPFALGAFGKPAVQRFRSAKLRFATVAFGRLERDGETIEEAIANGEDAKC